MIPTIKPTNKQHQAYQYLKDKKTRFLGFGGGAEGGKSWLGAEWLLTNCYMYPGTKWFIGRNELKRLMASSYATFRKVNTHHNISANDWKLNGQYNYIEYFNGSRIDLLDLKLLPSDPQFQRFGSTEYTGGWIEEAGEVHYLAFDVLKTRIGRWRNDEYNLNPAKILLTCNPEQNWLYRVFYKPWRKNSLEDGYAFIQSLYSDNPYTAKEAGIRLDQIKDKVLRARLKLGLWEYTSDDNSLVNYDAVTDLFTNTLEKPKQTGLTLPSIPKYLTADVARYGSDKIVFGNWNNYELYKVSWKQGRGIDQTAQDLKDELKNERIPYSHAIADDDGVGGGVVDIDRGIKGFVGNSSALKIKDHTTPYNELKDNYRNLRSQCGFMLAEMIMNHKIAITDKNLDETTREMIIEDLMALLRKKETAIESPLQLISKDDIKEILGRSPDFGDMMLMRMYFKLNKPKVFSQNNDPGGVKHYFEGIPA